MVFQERKTGRDEKQSEFTMCTEDKATQIKNLEISVHSKIVFN